MLLFNVSYAKGGFMVLLRRCLTVGFLALSIVLAPQQASGFDFSLWKGLLEDHVREGSIKGIRLTVVDYAAMGRDARFKDLLYALKTFDTDTLGTRAEKLAFWINVYNIFAISKVLEGYPLESIRDLGSIFRSVWNQRAGTIGGRSYSLNDIEHAILRPLGEPRIHFAIVCASLSCPDLEKEPFGPGDLDARLEKSTRKFLHNPAKGLRLDDARRTVYISSIFKWFEEDFAREGGVVQFISRRVGADVREKLLRGSYSIDYLDYDWSLNDSSRSAD